MFVRTINGEAYPASRLERIWKEDGPNKTIDGFADIDGVGKVRLWYREYERSMAGHVTFLSALAGWKTLERFDDDQGYELLENDVIGWGVYAGGYVVPVTLEGVDCGDAKYEAFLQHDGKIIDKTGMNELPRDDFYKEKS